MVPVVKDEPDGQLKAVRRPTAAPAPLRANGHCAQVEGQDERLHGRPVQLLAEGGGQPGAAGGEGGGEGEAGRLQAPVKRVGQARGHVRYPVQIIFVKNTLRYTVNKNTLLNYFPLELNVLSCTVIYIPYILKTLYLYCVVVFCTCIV